MKLGFLTAPFPDLPLRAVADFAGSNGFSVLEVACWPVSAGATRRYAGTAHIDVAAISAEEGRDLVAELAEKGVSISALGYYPNPLHPDAAHRQAVIDHLKLVISAAGRIGVPLVNTFLGGDAAKTRRCQLAGCDDDLAGDRRPCPRSRRPARHRELPDDLLEGRVAGRAQHRLFAGRLAPHPRGVRRCGRHELRPSHLVWQMIDQARFIREFGPHMLHVHAKDLMIDRDGLYENGILSAGIGWQVPRMPGLGEVDWTVFFSGLYRAGYDGPVVIEHEDRQFEGSEDKVKRGFLLARDVLSPLVK